VDEELRSLEQRAAARPDDPDALVRLGVALARAGERGRAARELARAVALAPGSEAALKALDSVAPGGLDPESPSPGSTGALGRLRRRVRGPARLKVVRRVFLERELDLRYDLAVDARGRLLATYSGGPELSTALARRSLGNVELDLFSEEKPDTSHLVAVTLDGRIEALPETIPGGIPSVLAGGAIVTRTPRGPDSGSRAGHGHLFLVREEALEAIPLKSRTPRWRLPLPARGASVMLLPGARVLVNCGGALVWVDVVTGEPRQKLAAHAPHIVVRAEDDLVFLLDPDCLRAATPAREAWVRSGDERPWALAGRDGQLFIAERFQDPLEVLAIDPDTGKDVWRAPGSGLRRGPKIDASGRIYWRRDDSLIVLDDTNGAVVSELEIGDGWNDFVFAAEGTIALLRRVGVTRTELVVVGE
jgi:hypothetical protein